MEESKNAVDNDARTRLKWAAFLAYPCSFFHGGVTRLPAMFAPFYASKGLRLPGYAGVLSMVIHSLGRTFGSTFLNPAEIKTSTVLASTLAAVVAFAVMLAIPLFPGTNCDNIGYECFSEEDNSFGKILVVLLFYVCIFVAGFSDTISTIDGALGLEVGHESEEVHQNYFRKVLISVGVGVIVGFAGSTAGMQAAGLYGGAGLGLFMALGHMVTLQYYVICKKRHLLYQSDPDLDVEVEKEPTFQPEELPTPRSIPIPAFPIWLPGLPGFVIEGNIIADNGISKPGSPTSISPARLNLNELSAMALTSDTTNEDGKIPLLPEAMPQPGKQGKKSIIAEQLKEKGFDSFTFMDYLHMMRIVHTPPLSDELVDAPLASEVQLTKEHEKEIALMKKLFIYFLGFGAIPVTAMIGCYALFLKSSYEAHSVVVGSISALGELVASVILASAMCGKTEESDDEKREDEEKKNSTNYCTNDILQQPIMMVLSAGVAIVICFLLGFVWHPDKGFFPNTNITTTANNANATITDDYAYLLIPEFWVHAGAAIFMGVANLFLHSGAVEVMTLYLPQDEFFDAVRLGYICKRVVMLTFAAANAGLYYVSPHFAFICTGAFMLLFFLPVQIWTFFVKFPLTPSYIDNKHAAMMEMQFVRSIRQKPLKILRKRAVRDMLLALGTPMTAKTPFTGTGRLTPFSARPPFSSRENYSVRSVRSMRTVRSQPSDLSTVEDSPTKINSPTTGTEMTSEKLMEQLAATAGSRLPAPVTVPEEGKTSTQLAYEISIKAGLISPSSRRPRSSLRSPRNTASWGTKMTKREIQHMTSFVRTVSLRF